MCHNDGIDTGQNNRLFDPCIDMDRAILRLSHMQKTLKIFFSARTKSKQDYEPDSLKCIQASISRYLVDGEC
jgi:hypothetical protein